jgi:HAD superfamily hydrolase (TIGR01509 family)
MAAADPRLVIFDCDGVLIDSEMIACRADAALLSELGFATTVEDVLDRYVGLSARVMIADIEARHSRPLPADFAQRLRARIEAAFERELAPMAGVEALLAALTVPRCVASSSSLPRLAHALALVGLDGHFAPHIFSTTQVERGKPAPDLFLFAARAMGSAPSDCLVVEDSVAGVQAGVAAGMRVIGFAGGSHCRDGHAARLAAAGAATIAGSMRELAPLLGAEAAVVAPRL